MITDPDIRDQAYQYFLEEAPELLQTIEEEIFAINEENLESKARALRVNHLMRAAHTLKGGAANVGLETIQTVAHSMEDVFKALYNPELELDAETKRLIYESYECLREPLTAEFSKISIDRDAVLNRAAGVFAQLQEIFGDYLTDQDAFPTSEELGLDVVESFFEAVIPERLQELATAVASADEVYIAEILRSQAEIFLGLAESLGLPGFGAIAQTILSALDHSSDRIIEVAQAAIANIAQAQKQVLQGDRESGGTPSPALVQLASGLVATESIDDIDNSYADVESQIFDSSSQNQEATADTFANLIDTPEDLKAALETEFSTEITDAEEMELLMAMQDDHPTQDDSSAVSFNSEPTIAEVDDDEDDDADSIFGISTEDIKLLETANASSAKSEESRFDLISEDIENSMASMMLSQPEKAVEPDTSPSEFGLLGEIWGNKVESQSQINQPANNSNTATPEVDITSSTIADNSQQQNSQLEVADKQREISSKTVTTSAINTDSTRVITSNNSKFNTSNKTAKNHKKSVNQTVRVNLESLEKLNDLVGEILINQNQNTLKDEKIYNLVQELLNKINYNEQIINNLINIVDEVYISPEQQEIRQLLPSKLQEIVQVNSEINQAQTVLDPNSEINLDQLLKLALSSNSELTEIAEKIKNHNKQAQRTTQKQQRMLLNMRDELIDTRMSPIGRVFNRFPRMIQQLSTTYNKKVELKITGGHILIDKTVEEKLYDPLLHLIRNGFDHGLETPEVRLQNGKAEIGTIELRAYYQGGKTIIEIKDDGKGINLEKIKNSAIKKKLITAQDAERLPASSLLELLFEAGFSTAEKVSSLSGRGVGLDVVRAQIEEMEGSISIESVPNQGTVFSLQIPLTLTIAKLMLTQADGLTYALLTDAIERIIVPMSNQIRMFEGHKVLHWEINSEVQSIPVRKLGDLIEYPRTILGRIRNTDEANNYQNNPILLLRRQGSLVGLEVEKVFGEQELVIRPLGSAIAPPHYIYGCSVLKDSSLTLVIDGNALLHNQNKPSAITQNAYLADYTPQQLPGNTNQKLLLSSSTLAQTLLVVDDSSSLRQSIAMSLEKVSQQVIQAENGLNALEKLQQSSEVNLVVCDLEMPMMNGFQFLKALRQNQNLRDTPVIILTSRDSDKHRKLALQLGAAAYLIKPCDEQELFDTISSIISNKSV
ncbi:MAG TPA: response regulator [Xenococcaceae cyanobacterium]